LSKKGKPIKLMDAVDRVLDIMPLPSRIQVLDKVQNQIIATQTEINERLDRLEKLQNQIIAFQKQEKELNTFRSAKVDRLETDLKLHNDFHIVLKLDEPSIKRLDRLEEFDKREREDLCCIKEALKYLANKLLSSEEEYREFERKLEEGGV